SAQQFYPDTDCAAPGPVAGPVPVKDENPKAPTIQLPICDWFPSIWVKGLRGGATVELTIDGSVWIFGAGGAVAKLDLNSSPSPLHDSSHVQVRYRVCDDDLSWSPPATATVPTSTLAT